jgi:hypothetical protein
MRVLHLSAQYFESCDPRLDNRTPVPACGATDGVAIIKRGRGDGLLHRAAYSAEYHCHRCIAVVLRTGSDHDG